MTTLGIHTVLIGVVLWIWTSRKFGNKVHYVLYLALILMYFISAAHSGLILARSMHPTTFAVNVHIQQVLTSLATFQFIFGDYVIMWRAWTVWNYSYRIIILPFCISCAAFGLSFFAIKEGKKLTTEPPSLLVANFLICTGLIVGRILYVEYCSHGSLKIKNSSYKGIVLLLIETGAIYTALQITSLILFIHKSPILSVFLDLMVPLMGLLPSTIVILVALDALPRGHTTTFARSVETRMQFGHTETTDADTDSEHATRIKSEKQSSSSKGGTNSETTINIAAV